MRPTHIFGQGGTAPDGVWRECTVYKNKEDLYYLELLSVHRFGEEPVVNGLYITVHAFHLVIDTLTRFTEDPDSHKL